MEQQYLIVKARNTVTGQTVKQQDLTGGRYSFAQRGLAETQSVKLAESLTARTGDLWQGFVEAYTPTHRRD